MFAGTASLSVVPPGLVHHEQGVRARCYLGGDFVEMPLHGLRVVAAQPSSSPSTFRRPWSDDFNDALLKNLGARHCRHRI
jgi:hypothetical protein